MRAQANTGLFQLNARILVRQFNSFLLDLVMVANQALSFGIYIQFLRMK